MRSIGLIVNALWRADKRLRFPQELGGWIGASRMGEQHVTEAELSEMGDDARFELFRGVLYPYQASGGLHGLTAGHFAGELFLWSEQALPGHLFVKTGLLLEREPDTVLAPDLTFLRDERMPTRSELGELLKVPPDIVVEIRSPANSAIPLEDKIGVYLAAGVGLVIAAFLDDQTLLVHTRGSQPESLESGDTLDGREILPELRVPVSRFFRG